METQTRALALLDRRLAAIESHPLVGNPNVRPSLIEHIGPSLRTFPVPPFVIVYRYDETRDRLEFLALPYDKTVKLSALAPYRGGHEPQSPKVPWNLR